MESAAENKKLVTPMNMGIYVLLLFALLRPLTVSFHHAGDINILEIFGIAYSYVIIVYLMPNLKKIRLDLPNGIILAFIGYCILSFLWGSKIREVSRLVLPFLLFFLARAVLTEKSQIKSVIAWMTAGYIIPIVGSAALIATGLTETWSTTEGVEKAHGLSAGSHTLAHVMLFFSFLYCLLISSFTIKRYQQLLLLALLLLSVYCLYKTYTRTAYIGFAMFWSMFLWGKSKKVLLIAFICFGVLLSLNYTYVEKILWQVEEKDMRYQKKNEDLASSGRLSLWETNWEIFEKRSVAEKFIGLGIGNELTRIEETLDRVASSHNDYLTLLMTTGVFGLLIYLVIDLYFFISIVSATIPKGLKCLFMGIAISIIVMNFLSNSYISRFPSAQMKWMIFGIFFSYKNIAAIEKNRISI